MCRFAALGLLSLAAIVHAQAPPQAASGGGATQGLAEPFVDGSEEYSIRPPLGWQLNRQRVPEARGITLLRMIGPGAGSRLQQITIQRTATAQRVPLEQMIKSAADTLTLEFTNAKIASQQEQQIAGKPGGFISATYEHEAQRWQRMHAFVEVQPMSYLTLIYNGPAELATTSERLFQLVAASLTILPRKISDEELKAALDEGQRWLAGVDPAGLHNALTPEQFLSIEVDGRPIGFLAIEQGKFTSERHLGVRIAERGWTFEADGRARSLDTVMFLSDDLQDERWKTNVTTLIPRGPDRPEYLEAGLEEGLRVKDLLLSSQAYAFGQPAVQNPALRLPRSYLPRALVRLLPRLVKDLDRPRRMAFTTFDHLRGDLVVRVVELKGESAPPTGASRGRAYRIDEREGPAAEPSSLYVDQAGRILYAKSGRTVTTPTNKTELERTLGGRVADADRRITQLEKSYTKEEERFRRGAEP